MIAWAICDTQGGRLPPRPLFKHLYDSQAEAEAARKYRGYDPQWYPIRRVRIEIEEEEKEETPDGGTNNNSVDG
jgi:hypothetical protein